MSNDAIGGVLRVWERMIQQIEQQQGQRGLTTWHARTKMVNSILVSPVVHGAYRVCTVADTSTFQFNTWDEEEVLCKWPHVN
jgi:hypothetical protein